MKILLPYDLRGGRKFEDPIITGGIEKFCNSIYENFDDVKVVEIPNASKLSSKIIFSLGEFMLIPPFN